MYNNTLMPISGGFAITGTLALCIIYWAEKGRVEENIPVEGSAA
jgi:DHA1 family bicyclomycin/chloramphenicol resistance-like MFS transporter